MWYRMAQQEDNRTVACVIIFKEKDNNVFVLLEEKDKNKFAIPGGKVESGETSEEAAVREILEETHLKLKKKKLVLIESAHKAEDDDRCCDVYAYHYKKDKEPKADSDCKALEWFKVNELPEMMWEGNKLVNKAHKELF